jgi:hypothetical protein
MGGATESRCVRTADVTVNRSEPVRLTVTSAILTHRRPLRGRRPSGASVRLSAFETP